MKYSKKISYSSWNDIFLFKNSKDASVGKIKWSTATDKDRFKMLYGRNSYNRQDNPAHII